MPNTPTPQYVCRGPKGVYYFRYALSSTERAQLNQKELHWSLRTKDLRRARRIALTLHDCVTNVLARGRAMSIHYFELNQQLLEFKSAYIQDGLDKIDVNGPANVEQRQEIRDRIALHKVELQFGEPSDYIVNLAKEYMADVGSTDDETSLKVACNAVLKMLIEADGNELYSLFHCGANSNCIPAIFAQEY